MKMKIILIVQRLKVAAALVLISGIFDVLAVNDSTQQAISFDELYSIAYNKIYENPDSAIHVIAQATQIAMDSGNVAEIGRAHWLRAYTYKMKGDLKNAFHFFLGAQKAFKMNGDLNSLVQVQEHLGTIAMDNGSLAVSKNIYKKRLETAERLNDRQVSYAYFDLGLINFKLHDIDTATYYFLNAKRLLRKEYKHEDSTYMARIWLELGTIEEKLAKDLRKPARYDSARIYYKRSLELDESLQGKAMTSQNIGSTYLNVGKLDTAEQYFNKALAYKKRLGSQRLLSSALNSLGIIHYKKGNLSEANSYFQQALRNNYSLIDAKGNKRDNEIFIEFNKNPQLLLTYQYLDSLNSSTDSLAYDPQSVANLMKRYSSLVTTGSLIATTENQLAIDAMYEEDITKTWKEKIVSVLLFYGEKLLLLSLLGVVIWMLIKRTKIKRSLSKQLQSDEEKLEKKYGGN